MFRGAGSVSSQEQRNGFAGELITVLDPSSPTSEAYRNLRTNLFYSGVDIQPKVIVLTSPGGREGKSTTCANLGVVLAQADRNTLIVDCDLRNPILHKMFASDNMRGLVDILVDRQKAQEVWQEPISGLKLITAGPLLPNPAELLSSQRLVAFLGEMRQEFDYVLVDVPPVGVSDSSVLAANADGVLLIVHSQRTRKGSLRQALRNLQSVGANVLGTVTTCWE